MKIKVKIADQSYEVRSWRYECPADQAEIDGQKFEVWPEERVPQWRQLKPFRKPPLPIKLLVAPVQVPASDDTEDCDRSAPRGDRLTSKPNPAIR